MKILLVEQFAKTVGRDSIELAEEMNRLVSTSVFLSDDHTLDLKRYSPEQIITGFHDVFRGNIFSKTRKYLRSTKELVAYIKKESYCAVILQWFCVPWIEWKFVKQMAASSRVYILLHDLIPFNKKPFQMSALSKIYNYASGIFIQSKKAMIDFGKFYPKVKSPIYYVGCAFGSVSNAVLADQKEARKRLGIPRDATVFLLYGTIRKSKGLPLLIEGVGEAQTQNKSIFLLVAGSLRDYSPNEIEALAKNKLLPNSYSFVFSYIPDDEEKWFFNSSDVVCLPYLEVTQSGVEQLAFHYKKALVVSDEGNLSDGVRDGENGYVFHSGDAKSLAQAISLLADSKTSLEKMGQISYDIGRQDFSLEKKAMAIISAINGGH